jgi:hypothetical protein
LLHQKSDVQVWKTVETVIAVEGDSMKKSTARNFTGADRSKRSEKAKRKHTQRRELRKKVQETDAGGIIEVRPPLIWTSSLTCRLLQTTVS